MQESAVGYVIEQETRFVIYRDPGPGAVLERRSFVGQCETAAEADAEVDRLEGVARFQEHFEEVAG